MNFPSQPQSLSGTLAILVLFCIIYFLSILASCPVPRKGLTDMSNERINSVICIRQGEKMASLPDASLQPAGPWPSSPVCFIRFTPVTPHLGHSLLFLISGLCSLCSLCLERVSFMSLPGWLLLSLQVSAQTSPLPGSFCWSLRLTRCPSVLQSPHSSPVSPERKLCLSAGRGTPRGGPPSRSLLHPRGSTWHTVGVRWLFDERTKE